MIPGHKFFKVTRLISCILAFISLVYSILPAVSLAEITFTDVASLVGVSDTDRGRGSIFFDCNGDGLLDIFVANAGDRSTFYCHQKGKEIFQDMTSMAKMEGEEGNREGYGVAVGDYDNDGDLDLYIAQGGLTYIGPSPNLLYRNDLRTTGTFTEIASIAGVADPGPGFSACWGDYDNDGWLDLYVANAGKPNVLYRNNGDRVVGRSGESTVTFTDVSRTAGVDDSGWGIGAVFADYDNDGDLDLYVANRSNPNVLYRNNGDGTFTDVAKAAGVQRPMWAFVPAFGDYDNDGDLDLYVTAHNMLWFGGQLLPGESNILYRNNGDGTFTDVTESAGVGYLGGTMGVAFADYDNDGYLDLYLANGGPEDGRREASILYHNDGGWGSAQRADGGGGTFTDVAKTVGVMDINAGHGVSFGDYDNDGDLDLYLPNGQAGVGQGEPDRLYRNNGNDHHWLTVKTIGTKSNRAGIGARVRVVSGSLSQIGEVSGGGGFGQPSLPVEFGLGRRTTVDSLIVRWPSGIVDIRTQIPVDQVATVTEGDVTTSVEEDPQQEVPKSFSLAQNFPNPFNASTVIGYALPRAGRIRLSIYDMLGREVDVLIDGRQEAGSYKVVWDDQNRASGIYFYRIWAEGYTETRKMLKIK